MKIALINDQPFYSGMGKYAFKIYELLKDRFDLEFLLLDYKDRVVKNQDKNIIHKDKKVPVIDNKPFFWLRIRNKIPDYKLYHFANQNLSFLIAKSNSIVTCHDLAPLITPDRSEEKIWRRLLYNGLKKAKIILADSNATKKDLIDIYKIDEKKVKTVYLGVEHHIFKPVEDKFIYRKKFQIKEGSKIILNVGTEKYRKNIPGLIYAFARLSTENKDVILVRVGKQSKSVRRLIQKLDIVEKVRYFENISENELPFFYNMADIFVMPSFYEGFGLPALEAMSCGIPVIVSNMSSLPEIVGDAGMQINPYSVKEIYERMKQLLNDTNLQKEFKEKGLEQAKKFTWQKTANEIADIYKTLLNT